MLDILSPLRGYIAQNLQFYLSKYIEGIQLEGLGLFGGDLVLNDLEIKRHVLAESLEIPSSFDFSRGFIRELRIHIPWTQLLSQPIEVKLYTIELILTARNDARARRPPHTHQRGPSVETPSTRTATQRDPSAVEVENPKSGWLRDTLHKILLNLSVQVNNLVLKYEQDDMVLSVALGTLECHAANDKKDWTRGFTEPQGPTQMICRAIEAKDLTIFLDRYVVDRKSSDPALYNGSSRRVVGYELPVLSRSSISVRGRIHLKPRRAKKPDKDNVKSTYVPSRDADPFYDYSCTRKRLMLTTEVGVLVGELAFSLSDRQLEMLGQLLQRTLHRDHSADVVANERASITPTIETVTNRHHEIQATNTQEPALTIDPISAKSTKRSWFSWAMEALGGPQDDEEDELVSEILAETREVLRQSNEKTKKAKANALAALPTSEEIDEPDPGRTLCLRLCINSTTLTLRKHDGNDDEKESKPADKIDQLVYEQQLVPVANVGLVPVPVRASTRPKVSKPATEVAVLSLTYTALEVMAVKESEPDCPMKVLTDLVLEVEYVGLVHVYKKEIGSGEDAMLSWGEVVKSEAPGRPSSSISSVFNDCVSHPYFVASFFGEQARRYDRRESRSFEVVKVSEDMEIPVWKTIDRQKSTARHRASSKLSPYADCCGCGVYWGGKRRPCVPLSTVFSIAKTTIDKIGIHDRALDVTELTSAMQKSWITCTREPATELSSVQEDMEAILKRYRCSRDPEAPAAKNLAKHLLPALLELIARICFHGCDGVKDLLEQEQPVVSPQELARRRSVHSAIRLRYVSAKEGSQEKRTETDGHHEDEGQSERTVLDVSLGPSTSMIDIEELRQMLLLVNLLRSKSNIGDRQSDQDAQNVTRDMNAPAPASKAQMTRLITAHSVQVSLLTKHPQPELAALRTEAHGLVWHTSISADCEIVGSWERTLNVGRARATFALKSPSSQSEPVADILALVWRSTGGDDRTSQTQSTITVAKGRVELDWQQLWAANSAVDSFLVAIGFASLGFNNTHPFDNGEKNIPVVCVELRNGRLLRSLHTSRVVMTNRVVDMELEACAIYLRSKTSTKSILDGGRAPLQSSGGERGSHLLVMRYHESKSVQHRSVHFQCSVGRVESELVDVAHVLNSALILQHTYLRRGSRGNTEASVTPATVDKIKYWSASVHVDTETLVLRLTRSLDVMVSPLRVRSDQESALGSQRRGSLGPGGTLKLAVEWKGARLVNRWRHGAIEDVGAMLDEVSSTITYRDERVANADRTTSDISIRVTMLKLMLTKLTLRHTIEAITSFQSTLDQLGTRQSEQLRQTPKAEHSRRREHSMTFGLQLDEVIASSESIVLRPQAKRTTESIMPTLGLQGIGLALRTANFKPKADDTNSHADRSYTDFQFSVMSMEAHEVHKTYTWLRPSRQEERRFGTISRLPHHTFLGVLLCLDLEDLTHVALAVSFPLGDAIPVDAPKTMAAWHAVNQLARHYGPDEQGHTSVRNKAMKAVAATTRIPLLTMDTSQRTALGKSPPVVSAYYRDYADGAEDKRSVVAVSMASIDIVVAPTTATSIAALLNIRVSGHSKRAARQARHANVIAVESGSTPSQEVKVRGPPADAMIYATTGRIRFFLPGPKWIESIKSGAHHVSPPPCLSLAIDHVVLSSPTWSEVNLDGLGYPAFNASLLPRLAGKPSLFRIGSDSALIADRKKLRLTLRVVSIHASIVEWVRDSQLAGGQYVSGPLDECLESAQISKSLSGREKASIVRPFSVTIAQEDARDGGGQSSVINISKIRVELNKAKLDEVVSRSQQLLVSVKAVQRSLHMIRPRSARGKDPVSRPAQHSLVVTFDGCDVVTVQTTSSLHLRCGTVRFEQSVDTQGEAGALALQNIVVGMRRYYEDTQVEMSSEELVVGPNSDPSAWVLEVNNNMDVLVAVRWSRPLGQDVSSTFIDVHGLQVHLSSFFLSELARFLQREQEEPDVIVPATTPTQVRGDASPLLPKTQASTLVKVLLGGSVASYSVTGGDEVRSSDCESIRRVSVWACVGQVFASIEVKHGVAASGDVASAPRVLNKFICAPMTQLTATLDHVAVRTSCEYHPLQTRFEKGVVDSIPSSVSSTWGPFSRLITRDSASTTLLKDCTLRVSVNRGLVVEVRDGEFVNTGLASTSIQIDSTPMRIALTAATVSSLRRLLSRPSSQDKREQQKPHVESTRESHRVGTWHVASHELSQDDFAHLHHRSERSAAPAHAGDLVLAETLLVETAPTTSSTGAFATANMVVKFAPSTDHTSQASEYDESAEVRRWIQLVNRPWDPTEAEEVLVEPPQSPRAVPLSDAQTIGWMNLKWRYHLPRKVTDILIEPVPEPPTGVPNGWPTWSWKDGGASAEADDGGEELDKRPLVRLCDIVCQLRAWSSVKKCYVTVAEFFVPWESDYDSMSHSDVASLERTGSFGDLMSLWFDAAEVHERHDQASFARVMEVTCCERVIRVEKHAAVASDLWELRWRSPLSGEQDKHRRLHVSVLLAASLNVQSQLVLSAFEETSMQLSVPRIASTLAGGHGAADAYQEMLTAEMKELQVSLIKYAGSGGSKVVVKTAVQVMFENLAQLLTVPILPHVDLHALIDRSEDKGTDISVVLGRLQLYLPQSAIVLLSDISDLLGVEASDQAPSLQIHLANRCGRDAWYRQYGTTERLFLASGARDSYSWLTLDGSDLPYDFLQFALDHSDDAEWCDPCRVREQVVTGRYIKDQGFLWVEVKRRGLAVHVTLRGGISVVNHLDHDVQVCLPSGVITSPSTQKRLDVQSMISDNLSTIPVQVSLAGHDGASLSHLEVKGMPSEFEADLFDKTNKDDDIRAFVASHRRAHVQLAEGEANESLFVVVDAVRRAQPASMPNDFLNTKIAERYTWTEIAVHPSIKVRNHCEDALKLTITDQDGRSEELTLEANAKTFLCKLDPRKIENVRLDETQGFSTCVIGEGLLRGGVMRVKKAYRVGSCCLELSAPSIDHPFVQLTLRPQLIVENHSRSSLLLRIRAPKRHGEAQVDPEKEQVVVAAATSCKPVSVSLLAGTEEAIALSISLRREANQATLEDLFSPETEVALVSARRFIACCKVIKERVKGEPTHDVEAFSRSFVVAIEKLVTGSVKIKIRALVTVHDDTGLGLVFSPVSDQSERELATGDVWEPPLRSTVALLKLRSRSGAAIVSWFSSALSSGSSGGRSRKYSSLGSFQKDHTERSCAFRVCVADSSQPSFFWSDAVPVRLPDLSTGQAMPAAPVYPRPCSTTPRHRLLLRHREMRHQMVTYTITQSEAGTVHVLFFVDHQPALAIENEWNQALGFRMLAPSVTPEAVAANHYMEYDWSMQQHSVKNSWISSDDTTKTRIDSWLLESSLPSTAGASSISPDGKQVKFQLGLPQCGWSNVLWQVPGIQFARFTPESDTSSSVMPVFLVTVFYRAGTWSIKLSCLDDPSSPRAADRGDRAILDDTTNGSGQIRFSMSADSVRVHLCDEHIAYEVESTHSVHAARAIVYKEVAQVSLDSPFVGFNVTREPPEALKTEARLGYMTHVRSYTSLWLCLKRLDVEHFLDTCDFPVILSIAKPQSIDDIVLPALRSKADEVMERHLAHEQRQKEMSLVDLPSDDERSLTLRVIHVNPWKSDVVLPYFHHVELMIAPVVVQVDDELLVQLQAYMRPITDALATPRQQPNVIEIAMKDAVASTVDRLRVCSQRRLFIDRFVVSDLELTVTARISIPVLNSFDGTPLKFSARQMRRVFSFQDQLMKDLVADYVADVLVRAPVLLMSLNIIGNPAGFFRNVGTGLREMFEIPITVAGRDGFNPWILTRAVLSGVASFVGHTSTAALTSLSGFSYSISKTVDHLTLTPDQLRARHYVRPTRLTSGISGGLGSLGSSVVGAATGIVSTPMALYQEKKEQGIRTGVSDVVGGVGMGLVGIVARPMGGVASLLAMTSDGLLHSAGGINQSQCNTVEDEDLSFFRARSNDVLRATFKILRDPSIGDLALAHGVWIDPSPTLLASPSKFRTLSPADLDNHLVRELVHEEPNIAVFATVICSASRLFLVGVSTCIGNETEANQQALHPTYEVIAQSPLADVQAIEESLTEPGRLDIGVTTGTCIEWYRLRLVPSQRRQLSMAMRQWLELAQGR